jgi:DNA (cytosine-5)-methyltransferase 1
MTTVVELNTDKGTSMYTNGQKITAGDFFAGGGGVTRALYNMPGVEVKWVLNHDKTAIATNIFHHQDVKHYWADVYVQDEHEMEPVDLVWASIECTQHSRAKGGKEKEMGSYTMGWELVRYIKHLNPMLIGIENVPEFKKWSPICENGNPIKEHIGAEFERWKKTITDMGYVYHESIRNAADDGLPTRRVRYFAFFSREDIEVTFPEFTHDKQANNGLKKWEPCRPHIDTENHGTSIFGRAFNEKLPKHLRRPICYNSQRRIGGGIKKHYPGLSDFLSQFLVQYYGGDPNRSMDLDNPIYTIPTANRHQLLSVEGNIPAKEIFQIICQYYGSDQSQSTEVPLNTVTTKDRHQLITIEKLQFIMDHCHTDNFNQLDEPLNPQLTRQTKQIVTFISHNYGSSGKPESNNQSLDVPLNSITTHEKIQFIASYFNSNNKPESQTQSLDAPLNTILTQPNKKALVTLLDGFDIKARFLTKEELASCSTFPRDYFSKPGLKLSNKAAIKLIGNAVPPEWARKIIEPQIEKLLQYKYKSKTA